MHVDGSGSLTGDHVVLGHSGCNLLVESGSATLTDSTVQDGGQGCPSIDIPAAQISLTGGSASLVRTQVRNAVPMSSGVSVAGGATFSADQSFFDDSAQDPETNDSAGVRVTDGTATITRSVLHGWGYSGVNTKGGSAVVSDSTFQDNVVGAGEDSGSLTVVRSTFEHEMASLQGDVSVAGSVLGSVLGTPAIGIKECNATVTDLGYNRSSDGTCGFTGTSRDDVPDLGLGSGLADWGGPVPTVATTWPSPAVDFIPSGATYGPSATPLCAGTDLRGVPRPQAGGCDAGSMELVATATGLKAPTTARPHASVTLDATVAVPEVGVSGIEAAVGAVTFRSGTTVLCHDVALSAGAARCVTTALGAGSRPVRATFTPVDGSALHASVSATRTIKVGTMPAFTSRGRSSFVVGTSQTFRVRASGSPGPRITLVKGRLPTGLSFKAGTGTATIAGKAKASAVGTHSVTVQATNLRGTVRQVLRIVVTRR
ncbi:MAG: choice-of-anchor Q domain-containing protein [Nocardioides sp.]